jgi:hypothetical protein
MNFKEYIQKEIHQMEVDKWCEGVRIGRDPGQEYVFWWIKNRANNFRKLYG